MKRLLNTTINKLPGEGSLDLGAMQTHINVMGKLAEDLLLYDQVLLLTNSYENVALLLRWMTDRTFEDLLEQQALGFVRLPGALAYIPASESHTLNISSGLLPVTGTFRKSGEPHIQTMADPHAAREVIESITGWDHRRTKTLAQKVARATKKFDLTEIADRAIPETLSDIQSNSDLANSLGLDDRDLNALDHQQAKKLLRVACLNMQMSIASDIPDTDLHADALVAPLVHAKIGRITHQLRSDGWNSMGELYRLPDVPSAIGKGQIEFSGIVKLRKTRNSERFREWFHSQPTDIDANEMRALYFDTFRTTALQDKLLIKTLRLAFTEGLGTYLNATVSPAMGALVSIADTYVGDKFLRGWTPKLFLDDEYTAYLSDKTPDRN